MEIDANNLGSKISENHGIMVNTIALDEIYHSNNLNKFILVSDIEGSEIEFILNLSDIKIINNCVQIIIELHEIEYETVLFSKKKMAELIISKFKMVEIFKSGNIWVFEKQNLLN